jgi:hypothetical protein
MAIPPAAAEWVLLAPFEDYRVLVDAASIVSSGPYVQSWFRWDFSFAQTAPNAQRYLSLVALVYFDCVRRQTGTGQMIFYKGANGTGEPIDVLAATPLHVKEHMHNVVPGTLGEAQLTYACDNAPKPEAPPTPKEAPTPKKPLNKPAQDV